MSALRLSEIKLLQLFFFFLHVTFNLQSLHLMTHYSVQKTKKKQPNIARLCLFEDVSSTIKLVKWIYRFSLNKRGQLLAEAVIVTLITVCLHQKHHSPVGICEEANLVSKIPAPSINASRIPPIAAEPTIATGPSTEKHTRRSPRHKNIQKWGSSGKAK